MDIPVALRRWFVAHFVIDTLFALPLVLAPGRLLGSLGWTCVDPVGSRLVGAALLGIGVQSFMGRNDGVDAYRAMLNLKIIWSFAAITGLVLAIGDGAPPAAVAFLATFIAFSGVWVHYRIRIKQFASARDEDPEPPTEAQP